MMFRKFGSSPVMVSLLMVLVGIVLIVWPKPVLSLVIQLLGAGLLLGGVISAIGWYRNRSSEWSSYTRLAGSIVSMLLGAIVLANPAGVASIFPTFVGVIVLVNGIVNAFKAMELKKAGYCQWGVSLLFAALTILVGFVFISQPMTALSIPVMLAGVMMVYNGLTTMWIVTRRA